MNTRETLGLILIVIGLILMPVAWMFSRLLWMVAFTVLFFGGYLFYTERMIKREEKLAKETGGDCAPGSAMPSDIHNYSGWGTGGRSETMDDSLDFDADD